MAPTRILPALLLVPLLLQAQDTRRNPAPSGPGVLPPPPLVLTPEQTETIMKQLEALDGVVGTGRQQILTNAHAKFKAASGSPSDALSLYLDCYKLEQFERKDLKTTDFMAWKETPSEAARLADDNFKRGLALQLEYLALTIQAQETKELKEMGSIVTALRAFVPKVLDAVDKVMKHTASGAVELQDDVGPNGAQARRPINGAQPTRPGGKGAARVDGGGGGGAGGGLRVAGGLGRVLTESVTNSEFCKAYQLGRYLQRSDWCYTPADVANIYDTVIIPYYAATDTSQVAAMWDARINAELTLRKLIMSETEFNLEVKERQPELLWLKARYMRTNNINVVQALADMLKVVRDFPSHPRAAEWLAMIREEVVAAQPVPATAAGAPQPDAAATPAPGTP